MNCFNPIVWSISAVLIAVAVFIIALVINGAAKPFDE